jgi:hypothetical protein
MPTLVAETELERAIKSFKDLMPSIFLDVIESFLALVRAIKLEEELSEDIKQ